MGNFKKSVRLLAFAAFVFIGLYICLDTGVFAQNSLPPLPDTAQTEAAASKVELKAPIDTHEVGDNVLSDEERLKAEEDAKIKEELNNEQRQMTEAAPLKVEDKNFDPNSNEELTKNVVPNTGDELLKLVSMFAKVMLGVILASFIIYFLLLFTRKFFHPPLPSKGEEDFDVRDLNSPKNTDDALKSFLDRTNE